MGDFLKKMSDLIGFQENQLILFNFFIQVQNSGQRGPNREKRLPCKIPAYSDLPAIYCWLAYLNLSPKTLKAYQKRN